MNTQSDPFIDYWAAKLGDTKRMRRTLARVIAEACPDGSPVPLPHRSLMLLVVDGRTTRKGRHPYFGGGVEMPPERLEALDALDDADRVPFEVSLSVIEKAATVPNWLAGRDRLAVTALSIALPHAFLLAGDDARPVIRRFHEAGKQLPIAIAVLRERGLIQLACGPGPSGEPPVAETLH